MLRCKRGILLITIEGDALDHQLTEGEILWLPRHKLCLVEGDATFVLFPEPSGGRDAIIQCCRQSLHAISKRVERMLLNRFHICPGRDFKR